MAIYIWLLIHSMVILCTNGGCTSVSMQHFDYLVGIGALEIIFESAGIVKIFSKKNGNNS